MYRNYSDRVEKINEALRGILNEQGKYKMYDPNTRTVVDSDAPGANRVFGEGDKAHIYQGGKKVYLNRPSYNKPLIDTVKTEPTKPLATTVPAEGRMGTIPTGTSVPVTITQPAVQQAGKNIPAEPKITDTLPSLGGPFKTAVSEPQEKMSRVATPREDFNKALEAVYKHGSTKQMPLASRSELEGYTRDDIEKARKAAIAPKPQLKQMTGGSTQSQMESMIPESVEGYVNYLDKVGLDEAKKAGHNKKVRRREGAKAARAKPAEKPTTEQVPEQQPHVPMSTGASPESGLGQEDKAFLKDVAARERGAKAAQSYLEANPKKTGLIASILKVLGRGK